MRCVIWDTFLIGLWVLTTRITSISCYIFSGHAQNIFFPLVWESQIPVCNGLKANECRQLLTQLCSWKKARNHIISFVYKCGVDWKRDGIGDAQVSAQWCGLSLMVLLSFCLDFDGQALDGLIGERCIHATATPGLGAAQEINHKY